MQAVVPTLQTSAPILDLEGLMHDLIEVCRSPHAMSEPEVGSATLALTHATFALSEAGHARSATAGAQARIQEAMGRAREALGRARCAIAEGERSRERSREMAARAIRLRRRAETAEIPPLLRAWTTAREVHAVCPACREGMIVRYAYRFMEGLAARELPCPRDRCMGKLTFHLPVNSFAVSVRRS
jgi:hypothetical protein